MKVNPYINYSGDCEAAFRLYERVLGAQIGEIFRYAGSPMADQAPPDWGQKVMHGSVTFSDQVIMAADVVPEHYEAPKGFSLSIHFSGVADAERAFRDLAEGGKIVMPLEKTFWAERFGMVVDPFGVPWMITSEADAGTDS